MKIVAQIVQLPENRVQQHHCMSCRDLLYILFELHLWCCMCNLSFSSTITRGGTCIPGLHWELPHSHSLLLLLIILAAAKISETISRVQFSSYKRKQVIFIGQMSEKQLHGLLYCARYLVQQTVCTSYIGLQCLLFAILHVQYFTE